MMENDYLVTVIIPVFNVRPYLVEALDSVINQTYKKLEIIIVDDGSTDGSGQICDDYGGKDDRVIVIHQENQGLSAARNAGLDRMTGDAVAFLDSDDKYLPDYILSLLSEMLQHSADISLCKYTIKNTNAALTLTGKEKATPSIPQDVYDKAAFLQACADSLINSIVWNKLYQSHLWKDIRFPVGHVYEDIATTFQIMNLCERIYVLDKILYIRRIRQGSITKVHSLQNQHDYAWALAQFESFIKVRIPEIFNDKHLYRIRRRRLSALILIYFCCFKEDDSGTEKRHIYELRNEILALGKKIPIRNLTFRVGTAYYLIVCCPWLLRIIYPAYLEIRQMAQKLRRRA